MSEPDRSAERIPTILARLSEAWMRLPGVRLGQLLENALSQSSLDDLFYVEDSELIDRVEKYVEAHDA